jgi:hypothetical protein
VRRDRDDASLVADDLGQLLGITHDDLFGAELTREYGFEHAESGGAVRARPSEVVGTLRHAGQLLSMTGSIHSGIEASDIWMKKPASSVLSVSGAVNIIGVPAHPVVDHLVEITGTEDMIGMAITMPRGRNGQNLKEGPQSMVPTPGAARGGPRGVRAGMHDGCFRAVSSSSAGKSPSSTDHKKTASRRAERPGLRRSPASTSPPW